MYTLFLKGTLDNILLSLQVSAVLKEQQTWAHIHKTKSAIIFHWRCSALLYWTSAENLSPYSQHENVWKCLFWSLLFLNGFHKHAFAGYEDRDVLEVEVYTFSKGNTGGHFTVTAGGSAVLKERRKPEPIFTTWKCAKMSILESTLFKQWS